MALKQVKNKIIATRKTGKVTKAMEAVSAVKMRKTQKRALQSRAYVHSAMRVLSRITRSAAELSHPLALPREGKVTLMLLVTSDKGLAGSVNSAVLKKAGEVARTGSVRAVCVGRKALEFATHAGIPVVGTYTNMRDDVPPEEVHHIAASLQDAYQDESVGRVVVVYQNFISTFEQEPTMRTILPLDPSEIHYIMRGIVPHTGRFHDQTLPPDRVVEYTVEPDARQVLNTLVPQLIEIMVYHALIESKASEHSARMVAMKNATEKAAERTRVLTLQYNKERQAAITAEVSEITGGIEAMG